MLLSEGLPRSGAWVRERAIVTMSRALISHSFEGKSRFQSRQPTTIPAVALADVVVIYKHLSLFVDVATAAAANVKSVLLDTVYHHL